MNQPSPSSGPFSHHGNPLHSQPLQYADRFPRADQDSAYSLSQGPRLRSWLERWYEFAAPWPKPSSEPWTAEAGDVARRGQLVAMILLALLATTAGIMPMLILRLVQVPDESSMLDVGVTTTLSLCFITLAQLNRAGHVSSAGLLIWLLCALFVGGDVILTDLPYGGYTWVDAPAWDVIAATLLVVSLTLRPRLAWIIFGVYVAGLVSLVVLMPPLPSTLADSIQVGIIPRDAPASVRTIVQFAVLLYRPVLIALLVVVIGVMANKGFMQALRDRDRHVQLAQQQWFISHERQNLLQHATEQQQWVTLVVRDFNQALAHGAPPTLPPLPSGWSDNHDLNTQYGLLLNTGRRISEGQRAVRALQIMAEYAAELPRRLAEWRASGLRADGRAPDPEYLAPAVLRGSTGSPIADQYLTHVRLYLQQLAQEDAVAMAAILQALAAYRRGQPVAHLSDELTQGYLGAIVMEIQQLVRARPS